MTSSPADRLADAGKTTCSTEEQARPHHPEPHGDRTESTYKEMTSAMDSMPPSAPDAAQAEGPKSNQASAPLRRLPRGVCCAPPPPLPPGYKFPSVPDDWYDQPKAWACRKCCRNFDWTYRPPREEELDLPCVRCREVLDADERAVEVNRLLLAHLRAGAMRTLALPVPVGVLAPLTTAEPEAGTPGSTATACTIQDAAALLGCGTTKVYELLNQGRLLPAEKFGRKRMVLRASVEALLNASARPAPPERPQKAAPAKPRARSAKSVAAAIAKLSVK